MNKNVIIHNFENICFIFQGLPGPPVCREFQVNQYVSHILKYFF